MCHRIPLEKKFFHLGIDPSSPGFYDTPAFRRAERDDPKLLNDYAQYVLEVTRGDEAYLSRARGVAKSAVEFLREELAGDGSLRICTHLAALLGEFLNRQGVWNFGVRGALTIRFGPDSELDDRIFPVYEDPDADSAHAWTCAPPFRVADAAVAFQPYPAGVVERLPAHVLTDEVEPTPFAVDDITGPTFNASFRRVTGRLPRLADIERMDPDSFALRHWHPSFLVRTPRAELLYIPFGCAVSDEPLERMSTPVLGGKSPQRLYRDWVQRLQC